MPHIQSFAPIEQADARILILGSVPGEASIKAGQYYALPQNKFWPIMGKLLGIDLCSSDNYDQRVQALKSARIALWDVIHSCHRESSLDSGIENTSIISNDFAAFFRNHPQITHVYFNGAKAEACYRRYVQPNIQVKTLKYLRLPSTSPANASISYERKLEAWRAVAIHI
ncbi:MAG TPA: DNA-deoxyinosine glycosylase [Gallionella sp.]|nr:DNA-deoxyinosine glycosylase [Gallionella sp.]